MSQDKEPMFIAKIKRNGKNIANVFIDKTEKCFHIDDESMTINKNKKLQNWEYTTRNINEVNVKHGDLLQICPNVEKEQCDRYNIFAVPGAGKSTFVSKYCIEYNNLFPNNVIYMISSKTEDKAFNDVKNFEYIILEDLLEYQDGLSQNEFKNCCVIFDDVNSIADKKLKDIVNKSKTQLLSVGRSNNINVLSTAHKGKAGQDSIYTIETATHHVIFPGSNKAQNIAYMKDKVGLHKKTIEEIMNEQTRYVIITNSFPQYYMTETKIKMI